MFILVLSDGSSGIVHDDLDRDLNCWATELIIALHCRTVHWARVVREETLAISRGSPS